MAPVQEEEVEDQEEEGEEEEDDDDNSMGENHVGDTVCSFVNALFELRKRLTHVEMLHMFGDERREEIHHLRNLQGFMIRGLQQLSIASQEYHDIARNAINEIFARKHGGEYQAPITEMLSSGVTNSFFLLA